MRRVHINRVAFGVWLILALLVGLSGRHFDAVFATLRFAILFSAPVSIGYLSVSAFFTRYDQHFDTEHPAKGSRVGYRFRTNNESLLPACRVRYRMYLGHEGTEPDSVTVQLGPYGKMKLERSVACPFRGVYTVGLAEAKMTDPLGLMEYDMPVWHRTFYVRPRVLEPSASIIRIARQMPGAQRPQRGEVSDPSLFRELGEYRGEEDAKRILWRYYASRGVALVRRYDSAVEPGLRLVLDTRPTGEDGREGARGARRDATHDAARGGNRPDYEAEDCSIELLVALARACVSEGIPVRLSGYGVPETRLAGGDESGLEEFVTRTVGIFFKAPASPLDIEPGATAGGASPTVYITHTSDNRLIDLVSDDANRDNIGLVLNTASSGGRRSRELQNFARRMSSQGRFCLAVQRADDLLEVSV